MTPDDLRDLLDRCGGDPAAWPPGAATGAERLLAGSPRARALLAAQQAVDRALRRTAPVAVPEGLAARALANPQARRSTVSQPVRWAAAAAAALVLGVTVGAVHGGGEDPGSTVASALAIPGESSDAG